MTQYKLSGDVQGLQQNPPGSGNGDMRDISFLISNFSCDPSREGLPKLLVVRMTIARPAPDFNGMLAEIVGKFGDSDGSLAASSIYVKQLNYRVTDIWQNPATLALIVVMGLIFMGAGIGAIVSWPGPDGPWPVGAIFIALGLAAISVGLFQFFKNRSATTN